MDTGKTLSWGDVLKKETLAHRRNQGVAINALGSINDIVSNAVLLDTFTSSLSSKTKLPGTSFMHSFYTLVNYNGKTYLLKLFAEEAVSLKSGEVFTRAYELKDIEKVAELPNGVHSEIRGLTDGSTPTIISVADIAAYVKKYDKNFNPNSNCNVIFKKYLKESPIKYLLNYRLMKSTELLVENALSITEVAFEVGFSNPSYFIDAFKKAYGLTPNEYRKKFRTSETFDPYADI